MQSKIVYRGQPGEEKYLVRVADLWHAPFYYCHEYLIRPSDWFNVLYTEIPWKQGNVTVYGKIYPERRLTCMFSTDNTKYYGYSGKVNELLPLTPVLEMLRKDLSRIVFGSSAPLEFNTVLANLYRDGNDYISMHNDSEQSLVPGTPIASISINCVRHFDIHCIDNVLLSEGKQPHAKFRIDLGNGSLLIMGQNAQRYYKHGVPVEKKVTTPRINLTFRVAK